MKIFYPHATKAEDLAKMIRQAIPGVAADNESGAAAATKARVIVDNAMNRLIVTAPIVYVGWSSRGASYGATAAAAGQLASHGLTAFKVDEASGELTPDGSPAPLRSRPIHLTTDVNGMHVLVAYNDPSGVSVHRLEPDGRIGAEVMQTSALDEDRLFGRQPAEADADGSRSGAGADPGGSSRR